MLLATHPNESKTYVHTKPAHTHMFIAPVFISAKTWKQLRCPSIDKWINNLCYISAIKYSSDKNKESQKDTEKSKCNFSNERSQSDKATYSRIPTT